MVLSALTARSVTMTWDPIACIERNGEITSYTGHLVQGGTVVPRGEFTGLGQTFTACELQPFTSYTFEVAGVNSIGTGDFATLTFTTLKAGTLHSACMDTNSHLHSFFLYPSTAPGLVSAIRVDPKFTSTVLSWDPPVPEERNGIIRGYEVTYRIGSGPIVMVNTTDTNLTIPSLAPNTTVSSISVSAYTNAGLGTPRTRDNVTTSATPVVRKYAVSIDSKGYWLKYGALSCSCGD